MKSFVFFLLFILVCAVSSLLFIRSAEHSSVTLAELAPLNEKDSMPSHAKTNFVEAIGVDNLFLAGLGLDSIFYAVLGLCGVVIAIRAVVSIVRALKEERLLAAQRSDETRGNVSRPERASTESPAAPAPFSKGAAPDANDRAAKKRRVGQGRPSVSLFARSRVLDYLGRCTRGLTGRMVLTFTGIVAAFGLLTIALVYFTLSSSLSKHVIERARVTAVNVSDGAPGFLLKNNANGLRDLLRKHASRPELAYILVENRAGKIFAHSFAVLPQEIQGRSSLGDRQADGRRLLHVGDNVVEEVSVPILEGRGGAVRVGIWREHVDAEINETVIPLTKLLGFVMGGGIFLAALLAWRINRPIFRLVAAAKAISSGDLDVPAPRVEDASEFGELSRAIERMRSSVKAAMIRLNR